MNSSELLDQFRSELSDNVAPFLWGDEEVFRWINDAQMMFCRLTEGIEDSSTVSICRISVVDGTDWYPLSPKVLKVRQATRTDTGRPVRIVNMEKAPAYGVRFNGKPGPLNTFVTGLEKHKLRAWPLPNENVTIELAVFRLPLATIDTTGAQEFEIDEQHHLALLDWVKHKAYLKEDAETFDRRKSAEFEARFIAYCDKAKLEQTRARREVGAVLYGGI